MISTMFLTNECPKIFQAPYSIWFCKVGITETTLIKLVDFGFVLFTDQQPLSCLCLSSLSSPNQGKAETMISTKIFNTFPPKQINRTRGCWLDSDFS